MTNMIFRPGRPVPGRMYLDPAQRDYPTSGFIPSDQFRAQMLAEVPAGQVVEREMAEILGSLSSKMLPGATWAPTPTHVSLRTVLDYGDPRDASIHAVMAGMRSPAAVDELREMHNAGHLEERLHHALMCNSLLPTLDGLVHIPKTVIRTANGEAGPSLAVALVDAVLRGESTYAEKYESSFCKWNTGALESYLGWEAVGDPNRDLLLRRVPDLTTQWARSRSPEELRPRKRGLARLWAEMVAVVFKGHDSAATVSGFAFGPDHDELVAKLEDPHVRMSGIVCQGVGTGRHVGRRLFQVTGDDPGLWSVALELMVKWDRSFLEWLEAVEALK